VLFDGFVGVDNFGSGVNGIWGWNCNGSSVSDGYWGNSWGSSIGENWSSSKGNGTGRGLNEHSARNGGHDGEKDSDFGNHDDLVSFGWLKPKFG